MSRAEVLGQARASLARARQAAADRWADFRGRSVYFQLKALVLLVYLAIVAVTLLWAPPPSLAKNQIGAQIMVLEGDAVVGPYVIVKNGSGGHWTKVVLEIDGGYTVERDLVLAGEKLTVYVKDFRKSVVRRRRGKDISMRVRAPVDQALTQLRIACAEGEAIEPLQLGEPQTRFPWE